MAGKPGMLPAIDHGDGTGAFTLHTRCNTEADLQEEDVQVIPLESGVGPNNRYKGWSQGKKNFTRMALKVLTDIYDKKSRALLSGNNDIETISPEEPRGVANGSDVAYEEPKRLVKDAAKRGQSPENIRKESASPVASPRRISRKRSTSASKVSHQKGSTAAKDETEGGMSTEMPKKLLRRRATSQSLSTNAEHKKSSVTTKESSGRRKANLASVIGIVAFRKIYMSKLNALTSETKEEHEARKETTKKTQATLTETDDKLPIAPRFSATLSPEAQFAVLKGYEDKLINGLKTAFPDQQKTMVRVKTPPYGRSLSITPVGLPRQTKYQASRVRSTGEINVNAEPDHSERYERRKKEYQAQRKVTGQVETAVDILDHLRGSSGHCNIISPRLRVGRKVEPVTTYNAWTHQWAQQFKIARRHSEK